MANAIISAITPKSITTDDGQPMLQYGAKVPETKKPYGALTASRPDFAGLTESAFHLSGLVRRATDKSAPEAIKDGKGGGLKLWKMIVGPSAYDTWTKLGRIDEATNSVTVKGLNELSSRTDPNSSNTYKTSVERIKLVAEVVRNGGVLTLQKGGAKVKFGAPVSLMVPAKAAAKASSKAAAKPTNAKAKGGKKQPILIDPAPKV
jgi:hypothetical protein